MIHLVGPFLLAGCIGKSAPGSDEMSIEFDRDAEVTGVRLALSNADPETGESPTVRHVTGQPLTGGDLDALLARVPELAAEEGDRTAFSLRPGSEPPPRTGVNVVAAFPSEATAVPEPPSGALEVARYAPEGEVPLAPHVSLTFSHPMVAVSSHAEAEATVPAKLSPAVEGHWRWLGTRTLLFDGKPRLPMATDYTVTVPAGTSSATGERLDEAVTFRFATPPPQAQAWAPSSSPTDLEPVLVVVFDQQIRADQLLEHLRLVHGNHEVPLRLATEAEVEADEQARAQVSRAEPGRWVALHPKQALERDTTYTLEIPEGTPSAEGPRRTSATQRSSFRTYAPLKLQRVRCRHPSRDESVCDPAGTVSLEMNNPLDPEAFDPSTIEIEPRLPGVVVQAYDRVLVVSGAFEARTSYTITLPSSLRDQFGQSLGEPQSRTVEMGPARPQLSVPGDVMVVLDPHGGATLPIASVNHEVLEVEVHKVGPEHWRTFREWLGRRWYRDAEHRPLPGERVWKGELTTDAPADRMHETSLDFGPWLEDGHGQFVVFVAPKGQTRDIRRGEVHARWVQVTELGLVAFTDHRTVTGWATDLATGAPAEGVSLTFHSGTESIGGGTTGADGLAEMTPPAEADEHQVLVARRGSDRALLPASASRWGGAAWYSVNELDHMRWYVTDDRGLYRPGETVRLFGWLRRWGAGPDGDIGSLDREQPEKVHYTLSGPRGNEITKGEVAVSKLGGFQLEIELPPDVNTGMAQLLLHAPGTGLHGASTSRSVNIAEFRRPEFEVTTTAPAGPHVLGQRTTVDLRAAYYAGGGLPGAEVTWQLYGEPTSYTPPGNSDYTFGHWTPWWMSWGSGPPHHPPTTWSAKTDGAGEHHLGVHFAAMEPRPVRVRAEGTVQDVSRQAWTGTATMLVHPSEHYVGVKLGARFVERGKPVEVALKAVDIEGAPVSGTEIDVRFAQLTYEWRGGSWQQTEADPQDCSVRTSGQGEAECTFTPIRGGSYRITAVTSDVHGRPNETVTQVWVAGSARPPARSVELEELTLVPEGQALQPGDTARILVQSPFTPAEGVLTVQRSGLVESRRFTMTEPTTVLEVPIESAHVPDLTVQVDLVGSAPRLDAEGEPDEALPPRVAHAVGSITFEIPPLERTLEVAVTPRDPVLAPGAQTELTVEVRGPRGAPVGGSELAVIVVDESVLALTDFQLPDPLDVFYAARGGGVSTQRSRALVALAEPEQLTAADKELGLRGNGGGGGVVGGLVGREGRMMDAPEAEMDFMAAPTAASAPVRSRRAAEKAAPGPAIQLRSDFSATALFAPGVTTDAQGRATVPFRLPDSLTRYRVMVVAVDGERSFGSSDAAITARKPLMVRPSAPRFLNFGDQLELPVVLQNQTDRPLEVDVGVRATNLRFVSAVGPTLPDLPDVAVSTAGRTVKVPAQDRVEVRFPAATLLSGTARLQVVASARAGSDAATLSLPVWTPATTEAFATTGSLDAGALVQPVKAPADVWPQFGGLELTTSSTQLHALTDAVLYLSQYPFECNEQRASRVLGIAALRDVLSAFEADGLPEPAELEAAVQHDIEELAQRQNWDGGFAFWRRGDPSWPYLSIHVAHAFAMAREKGYEVPAEAWQRSLRHLQQIERHIPAYYSERAKRMLRAYALAVLRRMGEPDVAKARALYREVPLAEHPLESLGFLLPTLHEGRRATEVRQILRHLGNRATESADKAHFVTQITDGAHLLLHSNRRTDGIVLGALLEVSPDDDLIEKVVRDLLAHRTKGRWRNTQENAFVLLALDRYFAVYEKETPDFVARAWLGEGALLEHAFRGRSTDRVYSRVPMAPLTERADPAPLTLAMEGDEGRLYYRIGMSYAPRSLRLEPADHGFAVERQYEALHHDDDVRRDADGTWHVRAGAEVRVRVTMATEMRRYHVALVDPMPAGLEAVNPELATSGTVPADPAASPGRYWWWWRTWYEHDNLRDERAEAFTSLLWEGVHEYTYVARATTPGRFVVPPPRAEEMYSPETFGRGATDVVVIDP